MSKNQSLRYLAQEALTWIEGGGGQADSLCAELRAALASAPVAERQYYYRMPNCTPGRPECRTGNGYPDCPCWHDIGTGPLIGKEATATDWRDKPASAPVANDRGAVLQHFCLAFETFSRASDDGSAYAELERAYEKARAALASAPAQIQACPTDVCQAAKADGVLCANDECDRASGVRPASAPVAGEVKPTPDGWACAHKNKVANVAAYVWYCRDCNKFVQRHHDDAKPDAAPQASEAVLVYNGALKAAAKVCADIARQYDPQNNQENALASELYGAAAAILKLAIENRAALSAQPGAQSDRLPQRVMAQVLLQWLRDHPGETPTEAQLVEAFELKWG